MEQMRDVVRISMWGNKRDLDNVSPLVYTIDRFKMAKNGTSRLRGRFWSGKPLRLRPGAASRPYDPTATLRNPKFVQKAIIEALLEGDFEAVIEIYRSHLRVLNRTHAAKSLHVSRQYIYKMLKPSNTPSLRTFAAFMKALGQEQPA